MHLLRPSQCDRRAAFDRLVARPKAAHANPNIQPAAPCPCNATEITLCHPSISGCGILPLPAYRTHTRLAHASRMAHARRRRRRPGAHGRAALGCARRQCRQRRLNPLRSAAAARWLSRKGRQGSGAQCARRRQGPPTAQSRRVQKESWNRSAANGADRIALPHRTAARG